MSSDLTAYNTRLEANADARLSSARIVLEPLIQTFSPISILDVGCGHGAWLMVGRELGIETIQGLDGHWIETDALMIPRQYFQAHSLENSFDLNQKFDLVISLEVAEHVAESASECFIDNLTRHGDIVLFSAAIPFQGGKGHLNEQWQSYWAEKFLARGYIAVDMIRPMHWSNERVLWWLRQNCILYVAREIIDAKTGLREKSVENLDALSLVHPHQYLKWVSFAGQLSDGLQDKPG